MQNLHVHPTEYDNNRINALLIGEEWQVRNFEPKFFQEHRAHQYPSGCSYESHNKEARNLRGHQSGDSLTVTMEDAMNACGKYVGINKENYIYDVMAVGDLEADNPAYGF